MLCITRKADSRVFIGDSIEVLIVEIRGDKVVLGITAPLDVQILRDDAKNVSPPSEFRVLPEDTKETP